MRYTYSSVRKLTLGLIGVNVNLVEIRAVFPNVTSLDLVKMNARTMASKGIMENRLRKTRMMTTKTTVRMITANEKGRGIFHNCNIC